MNQIKNNAVHSVLPVLGMTVWKLLLNAFLIRLMPELSAMAILTLFFVCGVQMGFFTILFTADNRPKLSCSVLGGAGVVLSRMSFTASLHAPAWYWFNLLFVAGGLLGICCSSCVVMNRLDLIAERGCPALAVCDGEAIKTWR